ncbi:MAG: 7-cyano-7-deazaguanine synthase QueC [Candidatus Omnitrophota bacterium]|jgi:7-cyano-7-deazaguanine synthase
MKKAIVLLSGGLDSAVTLYLAKSEGFDCRCLIFDYGQRHKREIDSAKRIAKTASCSYKILRIKLPEQGSSLLDKKAFIIQQAGRQRTKQVDIPSTYVPGRNIIFLSFALSFAEVIGAKAIFIGAHIQDYSGYPDCRKDFFQAFSRVINRGTSSGVKGEKIKISTPLISKRKSEIIKLGIRLKVPFKLTWSCYKGGSKPCGRCDSCYFRAKGFTEAGITDPLL